MAEQDQANKVAGATSTDAGGQVVAAREGASRNRSWISRTMHTAWANTDTITKWVQLVVVLVGGLWTYYIYHETEASKTETTVDVGARLSPFWVNTPGSKHCLARAEIGVRNQGIRSFDVTSAQVRF